MKKNCYFYMLLLLLLLLIGCTAEQRLEQQKEQNNTSFAINDAKIFFEETMQTAPERTDCHTHNEYLNPGEFVPLWNAAICSEHEDFDCILVPISSQYRFKAVKSEYTDCNAHAYSVSIEQQLVVLKNKTNSIISAMIVSFIPEQSYSIVGKGNIAKFWGIIIGSSVYSSRMLMVARYENGIKKEHVYIGSNYGVFAERIAVASRMMRNMRILRGSLDETRSGGEDQWWYESGNFYIDHEGNVFYDSDGDGTPEPWEPEPDSEFDKCPFCGGMGCGLCNGVGHDWGGNWNPGEQDPGDPGSENPGYGEGSGLWWVKCRSCGYYLGDVVPGCTKYFYCPNCQMGFTFTAPK